MELSNAKVLIASDGEMEHRLSAIRLTSNLICAVSGSVCLMPCLHLTCTKPVTLPHL